MQNPILQMLNGNRNKDLFSRIAMIKNALHGKDADALYQELMKSNPQFKKFIEDNQGKSIEDIAMAYDIDLSWLKK